MNISLTNWKVCVGRAGERGARGGLMTHLWLGVTLGSGPLKDEPATSEHM